MNATSFRIAAALAFLVLMAGVAPAQGPSQVVSKMLATKHNLGLGGTGTIQATSERDLCVFCHTPHVPSQFGAAQLWNHKMSTENYTLYSSEYLTSLNYDAPNQPKERSKLCLSCHDGTVALGAVYNNGGSEQTIEMQNGVTMMPSGSAGLVGTNLANDHPVGYVYDNAKDPELVARTWPWGTPIKLDPDAANGTVECITCHEPHDDTNGKFLRLDNTNAATCTFCHNKAGWGDAAHKTSMQNYLPAGANATTVGEWSCRSCHVSHNGEGVPYLLTKSEENTCYASGCHGNTGTGVNTKNIQSAMEKTYAHPANSVLGKHRNPDDESSLDASNRHAECQDCHNGHRAKKGLHTPGTNNVSESLLGVAGVVPGFSSNWTQPAVYSVIKPALQEYQICLKCHSSNAFGLVPNGVSSIVTPSGVNSTDQAMEFSPMNRSAHPVVSGLSSQTGSAVPRPLDPQQMTLGWGQTGSQSMYCSDCHGNDEATTPANPQGPHGSESRFMLTGNGKQWPTSAFGELWSLRDVKDNLNNWQNDLFCANCHPMKSGGNFANKAHDVGEHQDAEVKCVTCHVTVPHGAQRSRLIGYASDVPPYNYNGPGTYDKLVITGFRKGTGPDDYDKNSCSMNGVCHGSQSGVFEP